MLYEIDSFGFIDGYLESNWKVMSIFDLQNDKKLCRELERVRYEDWKKHNLPELMERWDTHGYKSYSDFEEFCRKHYKKFS